MEAFPNTTAGTFFSGVFGDHVVLQREPAKAAVYGVIFGAFAPTLNSATWEWSSHGGNVTTSLVDNTAPAIWTYVGLLCSAGALVGIVRPEQLQTCCVVLCIRRSLFCPSVL